MGDLVSDDEFDHDNLVETSVPQKVSFITSYPLSFSTMLALIPLLSP